MHDLLKLNVGSSTFEDAKALAVTHGGMSWWIRDHYMRCTWQRCSFKFPFENRPLTSTHLIPYLARSASVEIKDGVVVERHVTYLRLAELPFHYDIREESPQSDNYPLSVGLVRSNVDSTGTPTGVFIALNETSSAHQRPRAYAIEVSCLSRLSVAAKLLRFFLLRIPFKVVRLKPVPKTGNVAFQFALSAAF